MSGKVFAYNFDEHGVIDECHMIAQFIPHEDWGHETQLIDIGITLNQLNLQLTAYQVIKVSSVSLKDILNTINYDLA
jgi:hypothetical protein